jgi:hypothetical protein
MLEEIPDLGPRTKVVQMLARKLLQEAGAFQVPVPLDVIVQHLSETHALELERFQGIENLSGFVHVWVDEDIEGEQAIIGYNKDHPGCRQRFTISHEIGHLLMRHSCGGVGDRGTHNEREANLFAAELLMPTELVKKDFRSLQDIPKMSKLYRVSTHAMGLKLMDAKFLNLR